MNIKGYKTQSLNNLTLYYDDKIVMARVSYVSTNSYSQNYSWNNFQAISNIPTGLRPTLIVYSDISTSGMRIRVGNDGVFQYQTLNSVSNPYIQCLMVWARV